MKSAIIWSISGVPSASSLRRMPTPNSQFLIPFVLFVCLFAHARGDFSAGWSFAFNKLLSTNEFIVPLPLLVRALYFNVTNTLCSAATTTAPKATNNSSFFNSITAGKRVPASGQKSKQIAEQILSKPNANQHKLKR